MATILSGLQPTKAGSQSAFIISRKSGLCQLGINFSRCQLIPLHQARTTGNRWTEHDEKEFTNMLEKELDKIHDFQKAKVCSIWRLGT